jgi:3-dehydroquinate synthetase
VEGLTLTYAMRCEQTRAYEVRIVDAVLDPDIDALGRAVGSRRALVVATPTVDALYGGSFRRYVRAHSLDAHVVVLELGEMRKTIETVVDLCRRAQRFGLGRGDVFLAFGGGVCSDLVAFAASLVRRGVSYICVPTTLVAQVDAAIGLKGAVNFLGKKSYLGCFFPPESVLVDSAFLGTLPLREIRCGVAEIVKMALIRDADLFRLLGDQGAALVGSRFQHPADAAQRTVARAIELMLDELRPNGFEDKSLRRLVDFGHTFSPTLEERSGYTLRHGDAVAVDMALTCVLAVELGLLSGDEWTAIHALYDRLGLPLFSEFCTHDAVASAIESTTAHRGGSLNLVVPQRIGSATVIGDACDLPAVALHRALERLRQLAGDPPTADEVGPASVPEPSLVSVS